MLDIERLAQTFWVHCGDATSTRLLDRPDLLCRRSTVSPGDNEVVRFLCAPEDVDALIAEVHAFFADTQCIFCVFPHLHGRHVETALETIGFHSTGVFEGCLATIEDVEPRCIESVEVREVTTLEDLRILYALRSATLGKAFDYSDKELMEILKGCTGEEALCRRFLALDAFTGTPMSQGSMSLCEDLDVAMLFGGGTSPRWRQRGAYTALVNARMTYARAHGFEQVGIFAKQNTASPILGRRGFKVCGLMVEWFRDQSP